MDPVRRLPWKCIWIALLCSKAVTAQGSGAGGLSEENLIIVASLCTVFIVLLIAVVVTVILVWLFCTPCRRRNPGTWVEKAPGANELCQVPLLPFPSQASLNSVAGQGKCSSACYSQPLRSSSTSVVILNDMYRSCDSFVNKRGMLCSSLSELNRKTSSGLFERHYGGDGLSQDQNDYRIIEVETGMFSPSSPKAKSVACLRGLAEEEGGGVAIAPLNSPNLALLCPSSADLIEGNRKQKARSMDELAPQRLKRVVHFEDDSDSHPPHPVSSTHCGEVLNATVDCSDGSFVLAPKTANSVRLVSSKESGLADPRSNSQAPVMRRRSLDDIIDLAQYGEKPRGTPCSHSYATLDAISEDGTFLDDDTHHLDSRVESRRLHSPNNTSNEMHITMETTETIAMATNSGLFDEDHQGTSSTTDSCSSLSQPGPLIAAQTSTAAEGVTTQEPLSEEGLFSQNATQTTADEQSVVEPQSEEGAAAALQDTYQEMMVEGDEGSDASPVSQTSMEGTPPLKIKVSFTIIEEAERKVVKDPSPVRVGGAGGELGSISRSPQCDKGLVSNNGTTSQTNGSPKVGENLPLNTYVSAEEDSGYHGNQSADRARGLTSNSVHIIREFFLKQPQGEGDHARKLQPPDRSQRRKSKEMLAKRWPKLLEEERRWLDGDDDLLLCASVTTLDLTDSETDLQPTSEPNLHISGRVKVYSGSEGFTDEQTPPGPLVDAGISDGKQELEDVDWFSGVVTETLQFQMDKQDEVIPEVGGSHFALGNHSNSDDSTTDSTDNDSDDDEFVRPSIVSGLDLASMTPPPQYPTLKNILNHNQMYLPTSGESPYSAGDLPMMSLEHRKVSTKPRMSIIKEEEEALVLDELIRKI